MNEEHPITVRRDTAFKLLGIAGYSERKNVHVSGGLNHAVLTTEQISKLVERASEAKMITAEEHLIDA